MDCEKFDQVIIDALYDGLDELTLAAAKRHADGCPHCQAAWSGLKATRKIGILPLVEAPVGLDSRIMQAAREAQRNVPWPKRVGRGISWAGSYAMRPQTAMAAILLLMLGSSVIFVRVKPDRSGAPSGVSVTERGIPEQAAEELHPDKLSESEGKSSAFSRSARREDDRAARDTPVEGEARANKALDKAEPFAEPPPATRSKGGTAAGDDLALNAPGQGLAAEGSPGASAPAAAAAGGTPQPKDAYASAMELYTAGRYAEAEKAFGDVSSSSRNAPSAALYAAKSAESAFGCGKAAPKYESTASRYGASTPGAEALWGAANCYKSIGTFEKARQLYNQLRSVAGYRDRAEGELENLRILQQNQVAARSSKVQMAKPAAPATERPAATSVPSKSFNSGQ